ncbi:MAG: efflux RND transporter periplasmic adaptor subunit [Deltaproteobacteria bacterium]|nr:MAG: efflux RND transporter periplasmic adaptor subunit [Deltaproteobacteria bacterium]
MKKSRIWIGFVLFIIVAAVVLIVVFRGKTIAVPEYKTANVKRGKLQAIVSSTGTVNPINTVKVGSQISGNIKEIYVVYNSIVQKNQMVARIDAAVYDAQLDQARAQLLLAQTQLLEKQKEVIAIQASVDSARASLRSAQASFLEASLQFDRIAKLTGKKTASQSTFDEIQAKRDTARGAEEAAQANLKAAQAQLQRVIAQEKGARALIVEREAAVKLASVKLDYCTIRSPIDGIVIERAVDVGQTVAASLQSPILFTIAEDLKHMQLEVDVSEADVGQIQPYQKVEFTVDAFTDKKFKAEVRQIRNSPTNIQNVVTYKVIADVDNKSGLLRPGMTANVSIIVAYQDGVLKVTNAALRFRPAGKIKEIRSEKSRSITERPIYVNTVKNLGLDDKQAKEFEKILEDVGKKLKDTMQDAEDEDEKRQGFRLFMTRVFTRLGAILTEPQREKLRAYVQNLIATRGKNRGRPAQVFVIDEDGRPKAVKIFIGITNDTETEIKPGVLREDDKVIIGLASLAGAGSQESTNPLLRILSGRRN